MHSEVLFLNIAVAILVDSYVAVREEDKLRVKQEQIIAHPALTNLVSELELLKPSIVCTQLPCVGACKASKHRSRHRRTHPATAVHVPANPTESGPVPESAGRVGAKSSGGGTLTTLMGIGQKPDKYWVQPWAASHAFGVDELANALEVIGETKTAAQGGIGMAREHWKVLRKLSAAAQTAKAFFGASGMSVFGDGHKPMSNSSSVSDAADAAEEEATRAKQEVYVDFYTVSLRLAKSGAPGHLARQVADVFGKKRTRVVGRRKRLGSQPNSESSWGGSSRPSSQASGDSAQPRRQAFDDIDEGTGGDDGVHAEMLEKLAAQQDEQAVQMARIEGMLQKLSSGTHVGGL